MSIKEWKPEYERLSTEKLSLLGVSVLKEFDNGTRIIKIESDSEENIYVINTESSLSSVGFKYYNYTAELDLHELGSAVYIHKVGAVLKNKRDTYKAVLLNGNGNILFNMADIPETVTDMLNFNRDAIHRIEKLIGLLDILCRESNNLNRRKHNYRVHWNSFISVYWYDKYFVIKINYAYNACAIYMYDTVAKRCHFKSLVATTYVNRLYKNEEEKKLDYKGKHTIAVSILSGDICFSICPRSDNIYEIDIPVIKELYESLESDEQFLDKLVNNSKAGIINNEVITALEEVAELEGYVI